MTFINSFVCLLSLFSHRLSSTRATVLPGGLSPASGRVPGKRRGSKHTCCRGKEIMKDNACTMLSRGPPPSNRSEVLTNVLTTKQTQTHFQLVYNNTVNLGSGQSLSATALERAQARPESGSTPLPQVCLEHCLLRLWEQNGEGPCCCGMCWEWGGPGADLVGAGGPVKSSEIPLSQPRSGSPVLPAAALPSSFPAPKCP